MFRAKLMSVVALCAIIVASVGAMAADADKPAPVILQVKPRAQQAQDKRSQPRRPSRRPTRPSSKKSSDVSPDDLLRLRIELIEVETTPALAADLDLDDAWADRSLPDLVKGLSKFGPTNTRYRFDHRMLVGQQFTASTGSNVPFIRSAKVLDNGQVQSNVQYENVGCIVKVRASRPDEPLSESHGQFVRLELGFEVSWLLFNTPIETAPGIKAPVFAEQKQQHSAVQRVGETVLLTTFAAPAIDPKGSAVSSALIWRVRIDGVGGGLAPFEAGEGDAAP